MLRKNRSKIDARSAQEIPSDYSWFVCSHQEKIRLGTIWSVVATLKELQIYRAEGHPCKANFKQDLRLNRAIRSRHRQA